MTTPNMDTSSMNWDLMPQLSRDERFRNGNPKDIEKVIAWTKSQFDNIKSARAATERQWYLNLSFFFGKQNVVYRQGPNMIVGSSGNLYVPPAPYWRSRPVLNRIRPAMRKEMSKLTAQKPSVTVVPATNDDRDLFAAQAGEQVWDSLYREKKVAWNLRRTIWWSTITGTGFLKSFWDPTKIDEGAGLQGMDQPGDICIDLVTPFHLFVPDFRAEGVEDQPYIIQAQLKSREAVSLMFPGLNITGGEKTQTDILDDVWLNLIGASTQTDKKQVLCLEVWIKPGAVQLFPEGAMFTIVGDQVVQGMEGWPYSHGMYPYAKFDSIPSGKFYSDSVITDLIPIQREINRIHGQIIENKNRMAKLQLIAPKGSIDATKITTEPGQVIFYNPGLAPPQPIPVQGIPSYVMQELDRLQVEFDNISGQHEISRGQTPSGVTAGCVDPETQALTRTGWKSYTEIFEGDEIYAFDPETGTGKWSRVNLMLSMPYKGDVCKMNGAFHSSITTPDHKWWVTNTHNGKQRKTESQLLKANDSIPVVAFKGEYYDSDISIELAELLGWIVADGHFAYYRYKDENHLCGIKIHQSETANNHKCDRIQYLFDTLNLEYTYSEDSTGISCWYICESDAKWIRDLIPDKRIPVELMSDLSPELIQAFIDGLIGGDGSFNKSGSARLHTKWPEEAEAFQIVCNFIGKSVGIYQGVSKTSTNGLAFTCTVREEKYNRIVVKRNRLRTEYYEGIVWCPSVDTGFWLARKDGHTFVTGNTAIAFLQEQDDSILAGAFDSLEEGIEKVAHLTLGYVQQFWTIPRMLKTVGNDGAFDVLTLKGSDLRGNNDIRVEAGSSLPTSKAAKMAFIMDLMKMQFIPPDKGLQLLEMGGVQKLYENIQRDAKQAQRENTKMAAATEEQVQTYTQGIAMEQQTNPEKYFDPFTGQPKGPVGVDGMPLMPLIVPVNKWDNHEIHIEEHNNYRKSAAYDALDDTQKNLYEEHVNQHVEMLVVGSMGAGGIAPVAGPEGPEAQENPLAPGFEEVPGGGAV